MSYEINLANYLERIHIDGTPTPTLEWLAAIQIAHLRHIPFENLDVACNKVISIDPADVEKKLVDSKRGGYCFEQNTLIMNALKAIGFQTKPAFARGRWNRPPDSHNAYTHLIVIVTISDLDYLVDVGFGGSLCVLPLCISHEEPQDSPDGPFRVVYHPEDRDDIMVQWFLKGVWSNIYKFRNEAPLHCDLLVGNWWSCTSPDAGWRKCVYAARMVGMERHHLLNDEYCVRGADGVAHKRKVSDAAEAIELYRSVFGIVIPREMEAGLTQAVAHFIAGGIAMQFHSPAYFG